jgi:uncharacterized membrane protein YcaP (DUF421 family)
MPTWLNLDWHRMFSPSQPILETVLRGTVTYLSLFMLLRLFRRQTGSLGPADLLVLLLIADASQNAMAGEYRAITDGLVLVATIVAWEYFLDWLSYYVPSLGKLIDRQPLAVIENGKVLRKHLKRELMSEDELRSQLRQKGIDSFDKVKLGFIEGDGSISVLAYSAASDNQSSKSGETSGAPA